MIGAWRDRKFLGILILLIGAVNGAIAVLAGPVDWQGLTIAAVLVAIGAYMLATNDRTV